VLARREAMTIAGGGRRLPSRAVDRETVRERVRRQLAAMIPGRTVTIAPALHVSAMPARK
jgi:hypothetical protein